MNKTIYSIPKVFGGFGLTIILNLFLGFLTYKLLFDSKIHIFDPDSWMNKDSLVPLIFVIFLELLVLKLLFNDNRLIIVKEDRIIFISWCLPIFFKIRNKSSYQGCAFDTERDKYGNVHRIMYFIEDDMIADRISSFYYSNYDELVHNLGLNKVTQRKVSYWKKIFFSMTGVSVRYYD